MGRRTLLAGALLGAAASPTPASGAARAAAPGPSVTRTGSTTPDSRAIHFVSYDGPVNDNSFQKNGLLTHKGHQYAAWYTADRSAVVARRAPGASTWQTVRVGHAPRYDDSRNVISPGVSRTDGRLHLNTDSHSDGFTYVRSVAGLLDAPTGLSWTASRFGAPQSTLDGPALTPRFTYPQFVATPEGRLQLSYRAGVTGNGRNALAEYDGTRWTALGEWSASTDYAADRTANGRALHVRRTAAGTWRKTEIPVPLDSGQRTKLVPDRYDNAYAVLPYGRVAAASAASGHTDWKPLHDGAGLNAFGEVVIDESRVAQDGVLSVMYREKSTGTTPSPLHVVDFRLPA
ncbi:hypothetical protein GCM10019016_020260 [Streptomyces prasinosporus]|uniref:Tat pathway signal sequence domain protein n=1 Tax=Streptomyces prasinosporus TaxID=68256 RepID=A0ABP6TKF9_9ACTN